MNETHHFRTSRPLLWTMAVATAALVIYWVLNPTTTPSVTSSTFMNANTPQLFKDHEGLDFPWPPKLGEPFPDLELVSHTGASVRLSDFSGKIVLVEPIGMTCAACNAFSGAGHGGGYQNVIPQENLPSIEKLLPRYA